MYPPPQNLNDLTGRSAPGRRFCKGRTTDLAQQVANLRADLTDYAAILSDSAAILQATSKALSELAQLMSTQQKNP